MNPVLLAVLAAVVWLAVATLLALVVGRRLRTVSRRQVQR